jgi:hypothetical protein
MAFAETIRIGKYGYIRMTVGVDKAGRDDFIFENYRLIRGD